MTLFHRLASVASWIFDRDAGRHSERSAVSGSTRVARHAGI
jgi:hypothetical protein